MSISIILIGLLIPLTILAIAVVKSSDVWRGKLAAMPRWQQVCMILGFGLAVIFGGDKPSGPIIPAEIIEILTLRPDGSLTDLSGKVASGVQSQAISDYIAASGSLVTNAAVIVEQARIDCIGLTNTLLQADYDVAYIALDLPRGTPTATNHNISITFQKIEQTTTNLDALIWFSEMPTTNVDVYVEYSITEDAWATLSPVTNYWPATETVDGVECVRYRYNIPAGIAGTPLKPNYDISFGGYEAGQYLSVPETGVVVTTNGVDCLPFTGWDDYSSGTNSLLVRYVGGIAVEAVINGESIKGVN